MDDVCKAFLTPEKDDSEHRMNNFTLLGPVISAFSGQIAILKNRLSLIYHQLTDEATVYRVFEVLNSRGLDVKWVDKLKSQLMARIFLHADDGQRRDATDSARRGVPRSLTQPADDAHQRQGHQKRQRHANRRIDVPAEQ